MFSSVCFSRIYCQIFVDKEIKMLELETMFIVVKAVLYKYGPRFCLYTSMAQKMSKVPFKTIFEKIFKF